MASWPPRQRKKNKKLESARIKKGWTQRQVSTLLQVGLRTYCRWESGEADPHPGNLHQLHHIFGMSIEDLGFGHLIESSQSEMAETEAPWSTRNISDVPTIAQFLLDSGMHALEMAQKIAHWSPNELRERIEQTMMQAHNQSEGTLSRREVLRILVSTPLLILSSPRQEQRPSYITDDEVLSLCMIGVPACYQLYLAGDLPGVKGALPTYQSQLERLVQQPRHQRPASSLTSQAFILAGRLAMQKGNYRMAEYCYDKAHHYGYQINDPILQASALVWKAVTFFYRNSPALTLASYQEAWQLQKQLPPSFRGRILVGLAEAHSKLAQRAEAEMYLSKAENAYAQRSAEDPGSLYTPFQYYNLVSYKGIIYLNLNNPKKALETFEHVGRLLPEDLSTRRVDLLSYQTMGAVAEGDLEKSGSYLMTFALSAQKVGSVLSFKRSQEIYGAIGIKWSENEPRVKELKEFFHELPSLDQE